LGASQLNRVPSFDEFDKLLIPEPKQFKSAGLVFTEKTVDHVQEGKDNNIHYVYVNPLSNIKVTFTCDPTKPYCNPSISSPKDGYFFVAHYMKAKNIPDLQNLYDWLFHNLDSITPLQYLKRYVEIVGNAFATELKEIIEGKRWENIPIDWLGHK
jgi:hypothetical protein